MFLPHQRVKLNIVGSLHDREVACSASDRQGSNPFSGGQCHKNRLIFGAESYDILLEEQAGFRSNRSTVDNLFVLHSIITSALQNGKKVFCAFLDFRKAFDYLGGDCLWFKLLFFNYHYLWFER